MAITMRVNQQNALSMQMINSLEKSVDELPDVIESYIEKKAQQSITNELTVEEREMLRMM